MPSYIPRKLMNDIRDAIQEEKDKTARIFYITGQGGVGKTVLLRQVGQSMGSEDGYAPSEQWSGIQDLYHADVHNNSMIELRLAEAFGREEFQPYLDKRAAFADRRSAGLMEEDLEDERVGLAKEFTACLNQATRKKRLAICFDTLERLQFDQDGVQIQCHLSAEQAAVAVREWLLAQLPEWENCVVLLAGRPDNMPELDGKLKDTIGSPRYRHYSLEGFDDDEAFNYLQSKQSSYSAISDMTPEFRKSLIRATGGNPVRLDLAIEIAQRGTQFEDFSREIETLESVALSKRIDELLIQHIMAGESDPRLHSVLRYLAVARKGLGAEQLEHLTGWSKDECEEKLAGVRDYSFVKPRGSQGPLFLHDEMYRICDANFLRAEDVRGISAKLAGWYDAEIEKTPPEQADTLVVDSLLYRLRADPRLGYEWYFDRAHTAIVNAQVGLDSRLRNELLAFLKSPSLIDRRILTDYPTLPSEIDCDCAARWVKRYMFGGYYQLAAETSTQVLDIIPEFRDVNNPKFCLERADVEVYGAQAWIYAGDHQRGVAMLKKAIGRLEGNCDPGELANMDPKSFVGRRRNQVLGRAHNNLGYAYWMMQNHYTAALEEFKRAVPYFRASDLREEIANTNDNMGRVYALLYRQSAAESLTDDGLMLRRKEGRRYRTALSLISRALVHLAFDQPHRAEPLTQEALAICEELQAYRGIGLASIARARVLRHLGQLRNPGLYGPGAPAQLFREAETLLKKAIAIFEGKVREPVRLLEAYNELGCIYRDEASMPATNEREQAGSRTWFNLATQNLRKAHENAKAINPVQAADSCEDLAETYFQTHDYGNAEHWLGMAETYIPPEYKIGAEQAKDNPLYEPPAEQRVEDFWLMLGKVELLRGHIAYDKGAGGSSKKAPRQVIADSVQHYAFAAQYFEAHAKGSMRLGSTQRQIFERFKHCNLSDLAEVQRTKIPELAAKYAIKTGLLNNFFDDTLGLVVEMPEQ